MPTTNGRCCLLLSLSVAAMSLPYAAAYAFTFVDCLIVIGIIGCRLVDIIVFLPSWSNTVMVKQTHTPCCCRCCCQFNFRWIRRVRGVVRGGR